MVKKMSRAKVLTLSLVLAGMNTMYLAPQVSAAGVDVTTPVTEVNVNPAGYNSIKVSDPAGAYGVASSTGASFAVTMSGDRLIEATANNATTMGLAVGVKGASGEGVKLSGDGIIKISAKAMGGTGPFSGGMAYGLDASGGTTKIVVNGDVAITAEATGGNNTNSGAFAYGSEAESGTVIVTGNVDIKPKGTVQQAGQMFKSISLAAFGDAFSGVGTNDFSSTGKIKTIEGDVVTDTYGVNNLVLDTATSYLQGNILSERWDPAAAYGATNITISNGATWRPVYDNRYGTDCVDREDPEAVTKNVATNKVAERTVDESGNITLNKDGVIDLTWDGWNNGVYDTTCAYRSTENNGFRKLNITKLAGADGIIKVDSDLAQSRADLVTIGTASTATSVKVKVNYDNFYANSVKGDTITGKAVVVTDNSTKLTVSGTQSEYNEKTYNITVEQDTTDSKNWNITKIEDITGNTPTPVNKITENTKHAADSRDNVNNIWEIETNSLVKRLGDLRSMGKAAAGRDNLWAKYGHGTQKLGQGRDTEIKYNQFQVGYDKAFDSKSGKTYRGLMVSRINGDATYERGSGDTNSTTLGLYQTWLGNKGHYYDVILRYGKITTDYNVTDLSNNYSDADYNMWATTLSGEYGYRKELGKGAYIEPSAELILGHVGSADYTTSKNMDVYLDATKHAITRLGFVTGKEFGKANAYFRANYFHDFAGGGGVTTGTVSYDRDQPKNWCELGIGGNVKLSKNANAYAEVRKLFGNLRSNVNFSVGARWNF